MNNNPVSLIIGRQTLGFVIALCLCLAFTSVLSQETTETYRFSGASIRSVSIDYPFVEGPAEITIVYGRQGSNLSTHKILTDWAGEECLATLESVQGSNRTAIVVINTNADTMNGVAIETCASR